MSQKQDNTQIFQAKTEINQEKGPQRYKTNGTKQLTNFKKLYGSNLSF
jgi:hypothetical protein